MTRAEIDRLLALYSSGRISSDDREALYAAALEDPALFEELFEEDALREALSDPDVRDAALSARPGEANDNDAEEKRPSLWNWLRWPAFAAVAAAAVLAVVIVRRPASEVTLSPVEVAQHRPQPSEVASRADAGNTVADRAITPDVPKASAIAQARLQERARLAKSEALGEKAEASRASEPALMVYVPPPPPLSEPKAVLVEPPKAIALDSAKPVPEAPAASRLMESEALAAAPPSPARAPQARERAEYAQSTADTAQVQAAVAPQAVPVTATLTSRGADGTWSTVKPGEPMSQDTPLRLTVSAAAAGTLVITPDFTPPVAMKAGETRTFDLPRQEQGQHVLRVLLHPEAAAARRLGFGSAVGTLSSARKSAGAPPASRGAIAQPVEIRFEVR